MQPSRPNLAPYENPPVEDRVRALLCSDGKGQVQIVAPEHALVDPEPIRASTSRDLRSLPSPQDSAICAIPGFYGLPSVVHNKLKGRSSIALATETPGQYLRASGAQLHQMCLTHASFEAEFCETLQATPSDRSADEDAIFAALESFTTRRIQARLDETLVIPPLPETAQRVIALQHDTAFDLSDLVSTIEADPAIAARIMGWANSSFYGTPTPSKTLHDAIMRVLGFDLVFNMALGLAIGATLKLPKSHVSGASPYWLDAVYCAATMEALARRVSTSMGLNPGICYLAGLLSNFGTLVVGHVFPPQYDTICRIREANPQAATTHVDQYVLSLSREVLAATLLESWELPDEITTAVRFQNVLDYQGAHQGYVQLLALSQNLLSGGPAQLGEPSLQSMDNLGITQQSMLDVEAALKASQDELAGLAQSMGAPGA